jgi:uncharacterized protein YecT (DUF1311 family)
MRVLSLFALLIIASTTPNVGSAVDWTSPECQKNPGSMLECAAQNASEADANLNSTYREALKAMRTPAAGKRLRMAQRAWLAFRDSDCLVQVGPAESGGSMRGLLWTLCIEGHARLRTAALREILDCKDQPCPPTE